MHGTIFDIKEFSIHDGPGGRITVFLKGCPLRCLWCHNPEGLSKAPQLMIKQNLCTRCGRCRIPCAHPECAHFDRCIHACPNGCISVSGREIEDDELAKIIQSYTPALQSMDGGVTFSGGEPMLQADFVCAVADRLSLHKAIQTSGMTNTKTYQTVIEKMDYVMQDIKLADDAAHRRYTGVSNRLILKNIAHLKQSKKPFVLRVPLIPGITDTPENLRAIADIAGDSPVELLRYNPLAGAKYEMLGLPYRGPMGENAQKDFTMYFSNAKME